MLGKPHSGHLDHSDNKYIVAARGLVLQGQEGINGEIIVLG